MKSDFLPETDVQPTPRILLFGIYELGFRSLEALLARNLNVVGVVTKPEGLLEAQPITRLARETGRPVLAPESPRDAGFLRQVRLLRPDLIAVAGYHKILPGSLLRLPPSGVINVHGSLLPRYRGPSPWKWAIMNGETRSGATVQQMAEELDRGDILSQRELPIDPQDTGETLFLRISALAGPLLAETIEDLFAGRVDPQPQDEQRASYQGYPGDEDARICWEWNAERIRNQIRGLCPRPGAWTQYGRKRVRIRKAALAGGPMGQVPGMILGRTEDSLIVSTGQGNLSVSAMSIEGEDGPMAQALWVVGMIPGTFFDPVLTESRNP
ncbi:MAG TPA: methionyl-tRNA formyltransferase [Planctomycetota bacterium]|nr:methionyl-tRNA formyltransferase [Planctomycetota bacterium]